VRTAYGPNLHSTTKKKRGDGIAYSQYKQRADPTASGARKTFAKLLEKERKYRRKGLKGYWRTHEGVQRLNALTQKHP